MEKDRSIYEDLISCHMALFIQLRYLGQALSLIYFVYEQGFCVYANMLTLRETCDITCKCINLHVALPWATYVVDRVWFRMEEE